MISIKQGLLFTLAGIIFAQILYWFAKWCDDNDNDGGGRMSRVEENKIMVEHFAKSAMEAGSGTYEEMVAWQLGAMNSFLVDISKSLAIIADKMASPTGSEGSGEE